MIVELVFVESDVFKPEDGLALFEFLHVDALLRDIHLHVFRARERGRRVRSARQALERAFVVRRVRPIVRNVQLFHLFPA